MFSIPRYSLGSCLVPGSVKGLTVERGAKEPRLPDYGIGYLMARWEIMRKQTVALQVSTGAVGK